MSRSVAKTEPITWPNSGFSAISNSYVTFSHIGALSLASVISINRLMLGKSSPFSRGTGFMAAIIRFGNDNIASLSTDFTTLRIPVAEFNSNIPSLFPLTME